MLDRQPFEENLARLDAICSTPLVKWLLNGKPHGEPRSLSGRRIEHDAKGGYRSTPLGSLRALLFGTKLTPWKHVGATIPPLTWKRPAIVNNFGEKVSFICTVADRLRGNFIAPRNTAR